MQLDQSLLLLDGTDTDPVERVVIQDDLGYRDRRRHLRPQPAAQRVGRLLFTERANLYIAIPAWPATQQPSLAHVFSPEILTAVQFEGNHLHRCRTRTFEAESDGRSIR